VLADVSASGICRSRRSGVCGTSARIRDGDWFKGVKDQAAAFAAEDFFVGFQAQLLNDVRQNAHAAAVALAIAASAIAVPLWRTAMRA